MATPVHGMSRRTAVIYLVAIVAAGVVLSHQVLGPITTPPRPTQGPPSRPEAMRFLQSEDPGAALVAYHAYGDVGYALYRNGRTWGYWSVLRGGRPTLGAVNVYPSGRYRPPLAASEIWSQPSLLVVMFNGRKAAAESQRASIRWTNGITTSVPLRGRRMGWIVASPSAMHAGLVRWASIEVYGKAGRPLYKVTPRGIHWYIPPPAVPDPPPLAPRLTPVPLAAP